jgi:hypothetical protein
MPGQEQRSESYKLHEEQPERPEYRALVKELFEAIWNKFGNEDEVNLGGEVFRKIQNEEGVNGWYRAGSDPFYVFENGVVEEDDAADAASLALTIEDMSDEEYAKAAKEVRKHPLSEQRACRLLEHYKSL